MIVIVLIIAFSRPVTVAFYTEVVIGNPCQLTVPAARFIKTLCEGNAGRYAV